ncbi:beta strand repeat-containing protein, partial [Allomesorhizobium alhagi]
AVSGNGDVGVVIDPITADVVLTSITHDGGTSGVVLDAVSGSFTVTGETTISNTSGPAIVISDSPAEIRFADITIARPGGDGLTFAGTNGPVVVGDLVITELGAGNAGLDFSGSRTNFTAQSVNITGTGAAGSTGIDLSGTLGGSSIVITAGVTIAGVETGIQLGVNGSGGATANANFVFGGGTIAGSTAALDARGLNPLAGTYAFGSTVFNGAQLFDSVNIIFVGSAATGAGDGSSVNDLATIATADANGDTDAVFVLVNDGGVVDDADGFTLGNGQTLASFADGAEYALGGVPLNVTGDNVEHGATQGDPTGNGAATLTNLGTGNTVILGDGTVIANIDISNGAGGSGIFGDGVDGATLTNVTVDGAGLHGASFTGTTTNVSATNFTATGNGGSGLVIDSDGTFSFTGTTLLSGNADYGLTAFGDGAYAFDTLNASNNGILGIELISAGGGAFRTTGGTVSGNTVGGIAALGADLDVVLSSLSQDGGQFGATLAGVSGEFVMTGATTVANTSIGGLQIADSSAEVTFGAVAMSNVGFGGGIAIQRSAGVVTFGGPVSIDQSTSVGIGIDDSTGPVTFSGPVEIARTSGYGIALGLFGGNSGAVTFGDVTIDQAFGGISAGDTNGDIAFGNVEITGMDGGAGLDLALSSSTFTAASLDVTGTNVAGSTGIDLSGTLGGSVTITGGGVIQNVDTGVQLGTNGIGGATANTAFVFGGGSIEATIASLDMRGLNPGSGTYSFGATTL